VSEFEPSGSRILRYRWWLVAAALLIGTLTGFSVGAICQGRAEAVAVDPRIIGGSERQRLVADWVLKVRPDLAAAVTEVRFVPQNQLAVNVIGGMHYKERCFRDDAGRQLAMGRCVGEAEWTGKVRIAREYEPQDVQHLLYVIAHEYAHPLLYQNCGLCTTDEALADACAADTTKCRRNP